MKDKNKWIRKMNLAMQVLVDACGENDEWPKCQHCPFDNYCTTLIEAGYGNPCEWESGGNIDEENN